MPIGEVCIRDVLVAKRETTIREAAQLMRQHHVGDLVVVDALNGRRNPIGIVTDRDIVISVVATALDPTVFTLGDLVIQALITAKEDSGIAESIQRMRFNGVRRMPIVDKEGGLVGIVTVDDLVRLLSQELSDLSSVVSHEQAREREKKR
jgi:CBS domain-containing protein